MVVLSKALSHPHTPLLRLLERQSEILNKKLLNASLQVKAEKRSYRPNKKLTQDEVGQIATAYRAGATTYSLAAEYGVGRHTIARQLKKGGVTLRERNKQR